MVEGISLCVSCVVTCPSSAPVCQLNLSAVILENFLPLVSFSMGTLSGEDKSQVRPGSVLTAVDKHSFWSTDTASKVSL